MSSPTVHTPASISQQEDDPSNKVICKLCHRQFAKYTCPSCNVPYCSLACFRSPSHSQCSESFYKNELKSDIANTPSRSAVERKQMMELLQRFEEEAAEDAGILNEDAIGDRDDGGGGAKGSDEEDFITRFAGIDLDSLSTEDMWQMLTPAQKDKFTKVLADPSGELAQTLLGSEALQEELDSPWWEVETGHLQEQDEHGFRGNNGKPRPDAVLIPKSIVRPVPLGHPLVYNLCAVLIAYSYIIRHLGIRMLSALSQSDPDNTEALSLLEQLVPFLLERRSTVLHTSMGTVVTDIYSRLNMDTVSSETFAVLMVDTAKLIKPLKVLSLPPVPEQSTKARSENDDMFDASTHAHLMPILVLSDLIQFLGAIKGRSDKHHTIRKLEFYIAHVAATPSAIMAGLSEEALRWSRKVREEGGFVSDRPERMEHSVERQRLGRRT